MAIAHLLGDFVLQTDKMIKDVECKRWKSKSLYVHAVIHFLLLFLLTGISCDGFHEELILGSCVLALLHLIIDGITKIHLSKIVNGITNLFIDQVMHVMTIAAFVYCFYPYTIFWEKIFNSDNYLLFLSVIGLTFVSSVMIRKIVELFNYEVSSTGITNAGKYIGM